MRISSERSYFEETVVPPQAVETVQKEQAPLQIRKSEGPSPMSIFEQREKSNNSHLSQKKLITAEVQKGNGWYTPFSTFYSWVVKSLWGVEEIEGGLTEDDHKRVIAYSEEVRVAMAALDQLIENDEEVKESFDELMLMIMKHREALQKKTVMQQGEALKRAHKEVKRLHSEIKEETEKFLKKIESNGVLAKVSALTTPLVAGFGTYFGVFTTGLSTVDVMINPVIMTLAALSGANIAFDQPIGLMASYLLETAFYATATATPSPATLLFFGARAFAELTQVYAQYQLRAYEGTIRIKDNEKQQSEEKYNDLGTKASNEANKYYKGVGHLAELLQENLELIKRLWNG